MTGIIVNVHLLCQEFRVICPVEIILFKASKLCICTSKTSVEETHHFYTAPSPSWIILGLWLFFLLIFYDLNCSKCNGKSKKLLYSLWHYKNLRILNIYVRSRSRRFHAAWCASGLTINTAFPPPPPTHKLHVHTETPTTVLMRQILEWHLILPFFSVPVLLRITANDFRHSYTYKNS
jgi:hypothetical protein